MSEALRSVEQLEFDIWSYTEEDLLQLSFAMFQVCFELATLEH